MIVAGPQTSIAISPHAKERSWVMFVQVMPTSGIGPIKIEGVRGAKIGERLNTISVENPWPAYLIGLVESMIPHEHAREIALQFVDQHIHDGWFEPAPALLQLIQHIGQPALAELIAQTRPGAVGDQLVDIDTISTMLGVSVRTVRRLVAADGIPHMRVGAQLRFSIADVIAAMNLR